MLLEEERRVEGREGADAVGGGGAGGEIPCEGAPGLDLEGADVAGHRREKRTTRGDAGVLAQLEVRDGAADAE